MSRTALASIVSLTVALSIASRAFAEPPRRPPTSAGANEPQGLETEPRPPGDKVSFSLEDADLSELVRTIGDLTGRRFIVAAKGAKAFKGTIYASQKITVAEAYQAFLSLLSANAMTVIPQGRYWKIIDTNEVTRAPLPTAMTDEERFVTRVHRVLHVSADEIATQVLEKFRSHDGTVVPYGDLLIITDTGPNIRRMVRLLEDVDAPHAQERIYFQPLHHRAAETILKSLGDIVDLKTGAQRTASAGPAASGAAAHPGALHVARIVPIDRPNALVIVATQDSYDRIRAILDVIDVPNDSDSQMHVVRLEHSDAKKILPSLREAMGSMGSGGGAAQPRGGGAAAVTESAVGISADETNNALIITASPRDFASILDVVHKLDMPKRQVYIEAVIMDLSMTKGTQLGLGYHGVQSDSSGNVSFGGFDAAKSIAGPAGAGDQLQGLALGLIGPMIPGSQAIGLSVPALGAFLTAVAVSSDADILQTPHIIATDNVPAEIKVQLNTALTQNALSYSALPGLSGATGTNPAAALSQYGGLSAQPNYGKIGPRIRVTPHLNGSDDVRLDVEETISDLTGDKPQGSLGTVSFVERTATTTLTVRDQSTVVIGGLVRDKIAHSETKIPLLGDIPILGALFRSTSETVEKSNLILVLTPYIIRSEDDFRRIVSKRLEEQQEFRDHVALFSGPKLDVGIDYSRTRGLLGEIKAAYREVDEQRALEAASRPPERRPHEAEPAIELPVAPPSSRGTSAAAPPAAPSQTQNVHVAPATRNLDRIEN